VTRYVQLQERRSYYLRVIEEEGWTTVGSQGQMVLHPLARQLDSLEGKLVPLEDRLGLSPEASLRLGLATVEAKSKLDAFLEAQGRT
jgi:P27 family predicted phage terminase small subunit